MDNLLGNLFVVKYIYAKFKALYTWFKTKIKKALFNFSLVPEVQLYKQSLKNINKIKLIY
jgi:hypothetical protein